MSFRPGDAHRPPGLVLDRRPRTGRGRSGLDPLFGQHPALCAPCLVVHARTGVRAEVWVQEAAEGPGNYILLPERG